MGFISLTELMEASRRLEANVPIDDQLMLLLRQGTPIGGARPKATVVEDESWANGENDLRVMVLARLI